jgi:hypothetical protein
MQSTEQCPASSELLTPHPTEYIFYCKRAILFLSSSKILTPHPTLGPASLSYPRNNGGGYTLARRRGGWGVNSSEDVRHWIGLLQYNLSTQPKRRKTPRPVPAKQGATVNPSTTVVAPVDALITPVTDKTNSEVKRRFHIKATILGCNLGASLGFLCSIFKKTLISLFLYRFHSVFSVLSTMVSVHM